MNRCRAFLLKAVPAACALCAAGTILAADRADLMGYAPGAQVVKADVKDGRIDVISGIVYSQVKSQRSIRQLRMTVMTPRTKAKKPAVVYFPGGGFTTADHEKFIEMRYALARAGFVVAAAEYRPVPVKFPGLVEDGKAAVRYLREHADEYGIDPARIGVLGDSAGGYLVQMLGATNGEKTFDKGDFMNVSSDVQAVCSFYGISDLTSIGEGLDEAQIRIHASPAVTEALLVHGPAFGKFPGASILSDKEKAMKASSLGHIDGSEPPFLVLHGSGDTLVSPMQSAHLYEALKTAGVDAEYVLLEGAGHGDLPWFQKPVIERVVKFFEQKLGSPSREAAEGNNL